MKTKRFSRKSIASLFAIAVFFCSVQSPSFGQVELVAESLTRLTESTLHNSTVMLALVGAEFEDNVQRYLAVSGISGVSIDDVKLLGNTQIRVRLKFSGDFDQDDTLIFTVRSSGIENYNGPNLTDEVPVTANVESLTATTPAPLTEATLHNSMATLTLRGRTFEDNIRSYDLSVSGISGVDVNIDDVRLLSDTEIRVRLEFSGDFDQDDTLIFTVRSSGIENYNGPNLIDEIPVTASVDPRWAFKIRNPTRVTIYYHILWSNNGSWRNYSVNADGGGRNHWWDGQNVPSGYPKIRFDYIAGDQQSTYRAYTLETAQLPENTDVRGNTDVPTYHFKYNQQGDRLDLHRTTQTIETPNTIENIVVNQRSEDIYVIYSTWKRRTEDLPEGYVTRGHYKIAPGEQRSFNSLPNTRVHFHISQRREALKPQDSTSTFPFWIHRTNAFALVSPSQINSSISKETLTYSSVAQGELTHADGFMRYPSGSQIRVTPAWVKVNVATPVPTTPKELDLSSLPHLKSEGGATETAIIFVNRTGAEITYYWVDYAGNERFYGKIAPNASVNQDTHAGHVWLIKDVSGRNLAVFRAGEKTGQVIIGTEPAAAPVTTDLVISDIRLSKATLAPGEQFTLIATVENRGTGQSPATTLQFQRATNTSYTQIGTRSVSALSGNRSVEVNLPLTAPGQEGIYHYRAYIQSVNKHSEWVSITVVAPVTTKAVGTTHPHPPIYWTARGIGKIQSWDGLNVRDIVTGLDFLEGIAVDVVNGKVYWQQGGKLQSADLDGSNVTDIVTVNGQARIALDVAGGKIYWIIGDSKIRRANLDGSNVTDIVPGWKWYARDIALDVAGGKICWTLEQGNVHKIQCANLDGSNVQNIVTGLDSLGDIALDVAGGKVYWTSRGKWSAATETREPDKIWSADLDGSNVTDIATGPDLGSIGDIALDVAGGKMYWDIHGLLEDSGGDRNTHEIQSADLDGSNVTDIVTGVEEISVIALGIPPQTAGISPTKTTQVSVAAGDRLPMYWIDTDAGTLHRLVNTEVENLVPSVRNATSLTIDVANDKLYWTEKTSNTTGKIRRANLDGSNVALVRDLTSVPLDIALDAEDGTLYLTNLWGKVQRLNLDGSDFQPNLVTGLDTPTGIAVDVAGQKLYWTEKTGNTTGKIWRANLDGTNVALVRDLTSVPLDIALDAANGKLYLTNSSGNVQRLNLDGSGFQANFITGLDTPMDIAVDTTGQKLYLTSPNGKIIRRNLNGGGFQEVVTGLGNPGALVLGGTTTPTKTTTGIGTTPPHPSIYWISWSRARTYRIQRADLDGSNVQDLITELDRSFEIALDVSGGKMYWTSNPSSSDVGSANPRRIRCANLDGSNVTDLFAPAAGDRVHGEIYDIALDVAGGKIYWWQDAYNATTDSFTCKIRCADLDGSNITDLVTELELPLGDPINLNVAGGKIYWTQTKENFLTGSFTVKIRCADLDGSNVQDLITMRDHYIGAIALDVAGGKIYWTHGGDIQRADLDGSNVQDLITTKYYYIDAIALDVAGGKIYWTPAAEKIQCADLDGSNVQDLITGLDSLSVDDIALGIPLQTVGESPAKMAVTPATTDRAEDINQDGKVDNVDLGMVAAALFGGNPPATLGRLDVNGDGALTIDDLTQVSNNLDEDDAAAPALGVQRNALDREKIRAAIDRLLATDDGSIGVQRTLAYLQTLLAAARPDETRLLANYPNPFNPETWLPYALAIDSDVTLTLYDASGKVIRRLVLGYQSAGYYTSRSRAAYWDGRNAQGERVASGVYFYTLTAGDFTATRKLLILK